MQLSLAGHKVGGRGPSRPSILGLGSGARQRKAIETESRESLEAEQKKKARGFPKVEICVIH
jgi:hypothetical protein